ncbi:hypothetical protein [Flavobacterium album]|uniref:hypothetical protein n=1 Tax=Flavobacterium album TaxID=2175091 RepID=UPI0015E82615|nr:hypothetical protein [Flavobacterium album]
MPFIFEFHAKSQRLMPETVWNKAPRYYNEYRGAPGFASLRLSVTISPVGA